MSHQTDCCGGQGPDGSIIVITSNESQEPKDLTLSIGKSQHTVALAPMSFNTFVLK